MVKMNPDAPTNEPATKAVVVDDESGEGGGDPRERIQQRNHHRHVAPPMGNTNSTPSTLEDAKSRIGQRASRGSFTKATVKTTTNATKSTLTTFSHAGPQVGAAHHFPKMDTPPSNFNTASNEPVRVHQPMMAENPAAPSTMVLVKGSGRASSDDSTNFQHSAEATSAEAAPPKPLNSAHQFGHGSCCFARKHQANERPRTHGQQDQVPIGDRSRAKFHLHEGRADGYRHAQRRQAVAQRGGAGWLSFFKPKMKSTAAIKYPKGIHISASP